MRFLYKLNIKDYVIFILDGCVKLFYCLCYFIKCCVYDNNGFILEFSLGIGCFKYKLEKLKKKFF